MQLLPPSENLLQRRRLRLLLIDDNGWHRHALTSELARLPGLEVVAAVGAAEALLEPSAAPAAVDVALLHRNTVGAEGVALVRQLRGVRPEPIAILTDDETFPSILGARGAGAGGYLVRGDALDLSATLSVVAAGGVVLSPVAAAAADQMLARALQMHPPSLSPRDHGLSPQKVRVLEQLLSGCSVKDLAQRLAMTPRTARWYVSELLAHFGVASSKEVLADVRSSGLFAAAIDAPDLLRAGQASVPGPRRSGVHDDA